jgi:hypothetical protein
MAIGVCFEKGLSALVPKKTAFPYGFGAARGPRPPLGSSLFAVAGSINHLPGPRTSMFPVLHH